MSKSQVSLALNKLIDDLENLKSVVREINSSSNQQDALNSLDIVMASDRILQQSLSDYAEVIRARNEAEELGEKSKNVTLQMAQLSEKILTTIWDLEDSLQKEQQALQKLRLRLDLIDHLDINNVLDLGIRLAYTKGPPPNWCPGQPLGLHKPPYPTEDLMRSSLLFQRMNLGTAPINEPKVEQKEDLIASTGPLKPQKRAAHHEHKDDFDFLGLDINPDLL